MRPEGRGGKHNKKGSTMLRKSGIGIILALLVPSLASALGLGEYELRSYLNQPLEMTVEMRQIRDFDADEIIVSVAPERDYAATGVERSYFHSNLRFSVETHGDGTGTLRIHSVQAVREPYLNFLVEVLWPAGRMLREFTVLIDPPSRAEEPQPVRPAEAPAPVVSEPEPVTRPVEPAPRPSVREAEPEPYTGPRDEYRVSASDTMWSIALTHRADSSVSVQQMMRAIQELNPDAFIDGNVNLVREGAVLRLPAAQEVRNIATRQALADVADQNRQWREMLRARGIAVPSRPQLDGRAAPSDTDVAGRAPAEGRVTLVAPDAGETAERARGVGGEGTGEDSAALQNELAITQESLESLRRENRELSSRLDELQEQLGTGEQLLQLRNDQISRLQDELRRLQEDRGVDVADADLLEPLPELEVTTPEQPVEEDAPVVAEETDTDLAEPAAPATADEVTEAPPAFDPAPVAQPGPMDLVMDNLVLIAAGLGIIVIGAGGLLFLRQRRQAAEEGPDEGSDSEFADLDDDDFLSGFAGDDDQEDVGESEGAAEPAPPAEDPLEKVEVFMAYGQYPQAVAHLRDAIDRSPERNDLKLRLLEVLAEMKDSEGFEAEASKLSGAGAEIDSRIDALRADLGGDEPSMDDLEMDLTSDLDASPAADEDKSDGPGDFEFDLGDGDDKASALADDEEVLEDLGDFELDLPDEDATAPAGEQSDDELSFELDDEEDSETLTLDDEGGDLEFTLDDDSSESTAEDEFSLDFSLDDDTSDGQKTGAESTDAGDSSELDEAMKVPSSLDLDGPGASFETDEEDGELSLDDISLDDMSDDFSSSPETADSDDEELDLSLDDLSLEDSDSDATLVDTPALDTEKQDSAEQDDEGGLSLDDIELADDSEQTAASEAPDLDLTPAAEPEAVDSAPAAPQPAEEADAPETTSAGSAEAAFSDDEDFDFLGDTDENATKLDLAKAYIDMGDNEGARDILNEVLSEGSSEQQAEAKELLEQVG